MHPNRCLPLPQTADAKRTAPTAARRPPGPPAKQEQPHRPAARQCLTRCHPPRPSGSGHLPPPEALQLPCQPGFSHVLPRPSISAVDASRASTIRSRCSRSLPALASGTCWNPDRQPALRPGQHTNCPSPITASTSTSSSAPERRHPPRISRVNHEEPDGGRHRAPPQSHTSRHPHPSFNRHEPLKQLTQHRCRAGRAIAGNRPVVDLAAHLLGDRRRNLLGTGLVILHVPPRAVPLQPVPDMRFCSKCSRSGKYRNGRRQAVSSMAVVSPPCTTARSQTARCRYSSSTYGRISSPSWAGRLAGSIRGPATTMIRRPGTRSRAAGYAAMTRRSKCAPTPDPPTVTMHTGSSP